MKYMTFNSSCSMAGIANMLELFDIHMQDYQLALGMKSPYLFNYDEEACTYQTGASLQGGDWYNPYLNTLGICFKEVHCSAADTLQILQRAANPAMLGIYINKTAKHAVIFTKWGGNRYYFLNNRYQNSSEPAEYAFSGEELASRLDSTTAIGWLEACPPRQFGFAPRLERSLAVLERYGDELRRFCGALQPVDALRESMDRLFRPLLLDGLTMMQLAGHEELSQLLTGLQARYLSALRKQCPLILERELDMCLLDTALKQYAALIKQQIC